MFSPVKKRYLSFLFLWTSLFLFQHEANALTWEARKSKHFIVKYTAPVTDGEASDILQKAEQYYSRISQRIGYVRYRNYWTWEERVQILIYPNQTIYQEETGQPAWSIGSAINHHMDLNSRAILSFYKAPHFLSGILAHEIGHLILSDFIGDLARVPIWFNEGVAQLHEGHKKDEAAKVVRTLIRKQGLLPINVLHHMDVRLVKQPILVMIFYAQSVSIVDYMISTYGSSRFSQLCREIRDGKSFEEALRSSYRLLFDSLDDLEKKWLNSIPNS